MRLGCMGSLVYFRGIGNSAFSVGWLHRWAGWTKWELAYMHGVGYTVMKDLGNRYLPWFLQLNQHLGGDFEPPRSFLKSDF